MTDRHRLLRELPAVGALLETEEVAHWLSATPRSLVLAALQEAVDRRRRAILAGQYDADDDACTPTDEILTDAEHILVRSALPSLRRVVNATGIVLHTGLGRAPLCEAALDALVDGASGYCNLELDLDTGSRSRRDAHVVDALRRLTGAESATVVNNNAAATLLILAMLAKDREVIVSRGQLVEIGGSFRLPEIMAAGGAVLREVGTTNRTRISDYAAAVYERTAILMRVHCSNYRITGFVEDAPMSEIAALAHRHGLIAVDDLGSGALIDTRGLGLPYEPYVRDSIDAGADLVCFSGDKLLGGPQAGVIVGRADLIARLTAHPLMRAYRPDKLSLLALEATLRQYDDLESAMRNVPLLAMLTATTEALAERARALCDQLASAVPGQQFRVAGDVSYAGGGSLPAEELPTVVVRWKPARHSTDAAAAALRAADTPVVARIHDDEIVFDVRTIAPTDVDDVVAAVVHAAADDADSNPFVLLCR